ncbi:hypothetical protein [Mesobacillus subterraneus]|uniref:Uncharacterized protein n=1 Tax=Mesobacillus subterraneus TaxID=285983 RepID=A0A3R9FK38_9BACI|nr:hypothetical protein [Mesobacillus subterraneus]RSD28229.1 hypothetical protein EJA10_07185 [Mesobacillus subterraneus]
MQNNHYREFYGKALVPAGLNDRKTFLGIQPDLLQTHLLIGLQGLPEDGREFYHWNVTIYKSDSEGIYDACRPIYASSSYDRFDDAVEAARKLEKEILNDNLHTIRQQEKIS